MIPGWNFWDTFDTLINKNQSLDDIQRYHYLRSCFEGSAAHIIKTLEFSAAAYESAWKSLLDRYDNESVLVYNHVRSIFDIPIMTSETAGGLRSLLDTVSRHLGCLGKLGQPVTSWDTLLIYILTLKLDKITAREWEQKRVKLSRRVNDSALIFINIYRARLTSWRH